MYDFAHAIASKLLFVCYLLPAFTADNPKCEDAPGCGKWKRPTIKNPKYKGKWVQPMIDNPDYKVR